MSDMKGAYPVSDIRGFVLATKHPHEGSNKNNCVLVE
jgi:hypothetical protein